MFKWFEKRVDPYPEEGLNQPLPTTFFPFVWQAAKGVRGYLLILVLFTAGAASFEALFYAKIGDLVNWLSKSQPETFLAEHGSNFSPSILYFIGQYFICQFTVDY